MKNPIPRSIWTIEDEENPHLQIIDQRYLPHQERIENLVSFVGVFGVIQNMMVRGAPLIGITAAFGVYFALMETDENEWQEELKNKADFLKSSRPTAVNLTWAIDQQLAAVSRVTSREMALELLWENAIVLMEDDAERCRQIGISGLPIIQAISEEKAGETVNILTHCNAGSLACIEWGTATSPIYQAHLSGIKVHVWVDETRPRNQGAQLTAWELQRAGVPHTLITDNAGGQLMQNGLVDLVIVGTDRVTTEGDVANKIGTYLKALAAYDNQIPFYVALPGSTVDWQLRKGSEIEIEVRSQEEVRWVQGKSKKGEITSVQICPDNTSAHNYGFDITPARLVTAFITERGIFPANVEGLVDLSKELEE